MNSRSILLGDKDDVQHQSAGLVTNTKIDRLGQLQQKVSDHMDLFPVKLERDQPQQLNVQPCQDNFLTSEIFVSNGE